MTTMKIPTDQLSKQGKISGMKQLQEKGKAYFSQLGKKSSEKRSKEYFSELGKRSAAKRRKDRRYNKAWYRKLALQAAAKKRAKRDNEPFEPIKMEPASPLRTINNFLKGKF